MLLQLKFFQSNPGILKWYEKTQIVGRTQLDKATTDAISSWP